MNASANWSCSSLAAMPTDGQILLSVNTPNEWYRSRTSRDERDDRSGCCCLRVDGSFLIGFFLFMYICHFCLDQTLVDLSNSMPVDELVSVLKDGISPLRLLACVSIARTFFPL